MQPCCVPSEGAKQEKGPTPELSEAAFSNPSRGWGRILGAGAAICLGSLGLSSGCQGPSDMHILAVDPIVRQGLSEDSVLALQKIEAVESKLQAIDNLRRKYSVIAAPFLLLSDTLNEGYQRALSHHKSMCEEATHRKVLLTCTTPDAEDVRSCLDWGGQTDAALEQIIKLLDQVATSGTMPYGWQAPDGFEYIVEYRNKVFANK